MTVLLRNQNRVLVSNFPAQAFGTILLVEVVVSDFFQVLQMRSQEHISELGKITVFGIID
jgi:hypothetical protein